MITKFESADEKEFLKDLLNLGIEHTDEIKKNNRPLIPIWDKFRQRCFAYLEIEDKAIKWTLPTLADVDSELEETKCDVQNLFSRYDSLEARLVKMNDAIDAKMAETINHVTEIMKRLEESLINRIQENTNYICKTKSEEVKISKDLSNNVIAFSDSETQMGYKKLTDHNKLMIDQIIIELNSIPDSCLADYDIVGKANIHEVK